MTRPEPIGPPSPTQDAPHRARVLVVDDRPENLLANEALLAPLGAEVVGVRSGEQALRVLLDAEFAVVLMDVRMPGMDGLETAALIRARPRTSTLPILFLTAEQEELGRVTRAYEQGAVDFLVKPVNPEILRAKVRFFIELFERGELIRRQQLELVARRRMEEEARRTAELEQQITGIVGHDIRGPLSAILATVQVQLRKKSALADDQVKAFERIERSTQRIQQIVSVLLDYTRARVGRGIPLERKPTNLLPLLKQVVDERSAVEPERKVHLSVEGEPGDGNWDPARLEQVFANLLDNAAKYGAPASPIAVAVRYGPDDVEVEVSNRGQPIPAEKLSMLFEPFARGEDGGTHARTSLGLGLFIVREVVHGHGGEVSVTSTATDGTRFRIRLPRGNTSGSDAPTPAGVASGAP